MMKCAICGEQIKHSTSREFFNGRACKDKHDAHIELIVKHREITKTTTNSERTKELELIGMALMNYDFHEGRNTYLGLEDFCQRHLKAEHTFSDYLVDVFKKMLEVKQSRTK